MGEEKLILRTLRPEDEMPFRYAASELAASDSNIIFAFQYENMDRFSEYVDMTTSWSVGENLPAQFVPNTYFVGIVGQRIVGRLSLRHELNDYLERVGGHIGYCVVPSQRRRGYATQMLRQVLPIARSLGMDRVLLTCDTDNIGSKQIIINNGGVFENRSDEPDLSVQKNRYWIDLHVRADELETDKRCGISRSLAYDN